MRLAVGADRVDALRLVLGRGLALVGVGVGAGLPMAWLASRSVSAMLFGVTPSSWHVFALAAGLLALAAMIAMSIPAFRAARIDPIAALRGEA